MITVLCSNKVLRDLAEPVRWSVHVTSGSAPHQACLMGLHNLVTYSPERQGSITTGKCIEICAVTVRPRGVNHPGSLFSWFDPNLDGREESKMTRMSAEKRDPDMTPWRGFDTSCCSLISYFDSFNRIRQYSTVFDAVLELYFDRLQLFSTIVNCVRPSSTVLGSLFQLSVEFNVQFSWPQQREPGSL
ncbi:uncharacterized protein LY79DRAFT_583655 [Colletotrichum navitas]|uniref:Uncharacterized protein n=1 Tax=Colletotrichum navitas TaxID=681940 RepID=A0AAD8PNL0_9PEZI|nr:uncharacterized protein LY79DRAFT_583655 [Colletotrichum navitas]KAK1573442.1 hypothetical protein LY79DRAFT_583655 [Colletotrichum navitas]